VIALCIGVQSGTQSGMQSGIPKLSRR